MNTIPITTSQNVNIDFASASIGDRMKAFIIDRLIQVAYISILYFVIGIPKFFSGLDEFSLLAINILLLSPVILYTLALEILMQGQTIGKRVSYIKVVKVDGYQAGIGDYFIRWVFRLVDIWFSSGVVGVLFIIVNPRNQRLGGIASGTAVISVRQNIRITHTILEEISHEYQPTYPQVLKFTDADMQVIKKQLMKANATGNGQILTLLANRLEQVMGVTRNNTVSPKQFIELVIKDFNFYTGKE